MKFFDLFPAPSFLTLSEAGVAIGEREIRFISFRHGTPGELRIRDFGSIALPEGVIASGVVKDSATLTAALGKLARERGFRHVSVSLPEEKAYLYTTSVEKVAYKDLRDAVSFTVEENVPVTLANSTIAFEILPQAEKVKAAVSVLPVEVAVPYLSSLKAAGLTAVSIDLEPQAIARAVVERGDKRSHLIVNMGDAKIGFCLVDDEVVQFSSTLAFDSQSPDAVRNLKNEIRKFFVFWNTRLDPGGGTPRKIEHVILCGRAAIDESLTSNLMTDLETPYSISNVWSNVCPVESRMPEMPFDESLNYAASVGAALPQGRNAYV